MMNGIGIIGSGWKALTRDAVLQQEILLGVATIVVLVGIWLCWRHPRHRMSFEEAAKDRKLSHEEASRKIDRLRWLGPAVTTVGVLFLVYAVAR
jgi:hypothetical protein